VLFLGSGVGVYVDGHNCGSIKEILEEVEIVLGFVSITNDLCFI